MQARKEEKKDDVAFDPRFPASDPAKVKVVKMPQKPKVKKDFQRRESETLKEEEVAE